MGWPELGDRRDHLPAHHLDRFDPIHAHHPADHGLDAKARQPFELLDDFARLRPVLADVEAEWRRLLDRVVVATGLVAEPPEQLELARDIRRRRDIAGVAVAGYERQGPLLTATGDEDRRMGPAQALRHVQRPTEANVAPLERPLVAALAGPHPQADLHGLLEDLEPLAERRIRQPEPHGFLFVVAGTDPEHRPTAREH